MKSRILMLAAAAAAFLVAAGLHAAEKSLKDVKCPVSGQPVKATAIVEFNDGDVYFCCNNCPKAFKADTAKYEAKANHQMVQTGELVQVACPLTGKKTKAETAVKIDGVEVAFCCNGCKGKVEKASDKEKLDIVFKDTSKGFKSKD